MKCANAPAHQFCHYPCGFIYTTAWCALLLSNDRHRSTPSFFYQTKKKVPLLFHKKKKEFFLKPADTQCISNYSIRGFSILSVAHVTYVLIKKQSGCHSSEIRSLIIGTFFKTSEKYRISLYSTEISTDLKWEIIWHFEKYTFIP